MAEELAEIVTLEPTAADVKLKALYPRLQNRSSFPELNGAAKETCGRLIPPLLNSPCRLSLLATIRILSRDPAEMDLLYSEAVFEKLLGMAGLAGEETREIECEIEAVKILCNLGFQSEKLRARLAAAPFRRLVELLPRRQDPIDLRRFRCRLFFVLTIREPALRDSARRDLQCLAILASVLSEFAKVSVTLEEAEVLEELLKSLYNVAMTLPGSKVIEETDEKACEQLVLQSRILLVVQIPSKPEMEHSLRSHSVNLLTVMPGSVLDHLSSASQEEDGRRRFMGRDPGAWAALLSFLDSQLSAWSAGKENSLSLVPILVVLVNVTMDNRPARKWLREKVLPPLGSDVMRRPEEGETIRNRLARVMTAPDGQSPYLAATFLFHLCKNNVERLIKYTGFGNAAGLLASNGLLAGQRTVPGEGDSNDEDSDTEEYQKVKPKVNPVTGCYEEDTSNPMEGMTEEQKEYEAMRLVDEINRLMNQGVIRPARIGADGKPEPVEHILELTKDVKLEDREED